MMFRRSVRFRVGNGLLFMLLLLGVAACSGPRAAGGKAPSGPIPLAECLVLIPDSMLNLHQNYFPEMRLTTAQADSLIEYGRVSQTADFAHLERTEFLPEKGWLRVRMMGVDNGVEYILKQWQDASGKELLAICRYTTDHCCTFSKLSIYETKDGKLKDVTKKRLPLIVLADFVAQAAIPNAEGTSITHFAYILELKPENNVVRVQLEVDYIELSYDGAVASRMMESIVTQEIVLVWKDGGFRKEMR